MRAILQFLLAMITAAISVPLPAAAPPDLGALADRAKIAHPSAPRKVLAFYYPWYGSPDGPGGRGRWAHWDGVEPEQKRIATSTHYPVLGAYDSHDPAVIRQHCSWARRAGLDGWIVSWWGKDSYCDRAMDAILDAAAEAKLEVTIYHEAVPAPKNARSAADDLVAVLRRYAGHPAWLRAGGKPVVFIYGRAVNEIGLLPWAEACAAVNREYPGGVVLVGDKFSTAAARVFDGIHTYNTAGMLRDMPRERVGNWAAEQYPQWVAMADRFQRISTLTVIPGYDDTKIRKPGLAVERFGGDSYRAQWDEAIKANPDFVLITSFNEWHEGSEIEPSAEYGDKYLEITAEMTARFKAQGPRAPAKPVPSGGAVSEQEKRAVLERLSTVPVGILPGADLGPVWPLLGMSKAPAALSWQEVADLEQADAGRLPLLVYAGDEQYQRTARQAGDVDQGLIRYLRGGGCLALIPAGPMPLHYDENRKPVNTTEKLGLPLSVGGKEGGWETPPQGVKLHFACDTVALPHLPREFPFPTSGDLRWRPLKRERLAPGDLVVPLIELGDDKGAGYGLAAAYVEHRESEPKGGRLLYLWFGLAETEQGETLLYDVYALLARQLGGRAGGRTPE